MSRPVLAECAEGLNSKAVHPPRMHRRALESLACPECVLHLTEVPFGSEPLHWRGLRCEQGHEFEIDAGVPLLVRESDRPRMRAFATSYASTWVKDGWGGSERAYLASLPYRDVSGRRSSEWRVKARSMESLFRVLNPRIHRRVVDLGCGIGWLSHRLAARDHEVYAVDVVMDGMIGLRAAGAYLELGTPFERVCGDLHRLPFMSSIIDAVVCNASLHYADNLKTSLTEIARILRPGGLLTILNSPVHDDGSSAARAESDFRGHLRSLGASQEVIAAYHHFTRAQLDAELERAIGRINAHPFDPGRWFRWSRRLKGIALRMELASFPILSVTNRKGVGPPSS